MSSVYVQPTTVAFPESEWAHLRSGSLPRAYRPGPTTQGPVNVGTAGSPAPLSQVECVCVYVKREGESERGRTQQGNSTNHAQSVSKGFTL